MRHKPPLGHVLRDQRNLRPRSGALWWQWPRERVEIASVHQVGRLYERVPNRKLYTFIRRPPRRMRMHAFIDSFLKTSRVQYPATLEYQYVYTKSVVGLEVPG